MRSADPLVLGFDTAGPYCTAAVLNRTEVLAHRTEEMAKGQAERLMGLLDDTLRKAGISFPDLTSIGVGIGPGNFTGIRISVSAARGLALGLDIPAVGISGFEALRLGTDGPCVCTIPARRGHVFMQVFDACGEATTPIELPEDDLPTSEGTILGSSGTPGMYPTAVAIARSVLLHNAQAPQRPAPLYVRPANAAPSREPAPVILP